MKRNPISAGWAWKPDATTEAALRRGASKLRRAKAHNNEEAKMATKKATAKKTSTRKTSAKKVSKKGTAKKVTAKKATNGNRIPLKKICQELKIDPKLARRKLRSADLAGHDAKARWDFTPAQAKKAKEVLSA
jgi:hypothetical protein